MSSTDWFEAFDHHRWQQETPPAHHTMSTIDTSSDTITAEQVLAYVEKHLLAFGEKAPGYINLAVEATWLRTHSPTIKFRAYCENIGHSALQDTPESAIAEVVAKVNGRSQAEILRAQAAEIMKKADEAERMAANLEGRGA